MANKKTMDAKMAATVSAGVEASPEIANDIPTPTSYKAKEKVPSELWHCVEDATGLGTMALNLPSGCLIMTVVDQIQSALQYVPGIHYDEANKRFSV